MKKCFAVLLCIGIMASVYGYSLNAHGYITDWLVRTPYPSYQVDGTIDLGGTGFNEDFMASMYGSERGAHPAPGHSREVVFVADEAKLIAGIGATNEWGVRNNISTKVEWKELHYPESDVYYKLDYGLAPLNDFIVTYLGCYIYSPINQQVKFCGGCDDDHKIYLNGDIIGFANGSSAAEPNKFAYTAQLKKGLNTLLVKIVDRIADHGVMIGIFDDHGAPVKDLQIYVESPEDAIRKTGKCKKVLNWDNGFYVGFTDDCALMKGQNKLHLILGMPGDLAYGIAIKLFQNSRRIYDTKFSGCQMVNRNFDIDLTGDDNVVMKVEFRGEDNNEYKELEVNLPVISSEKIERELNVLRNEKGKLEQTIKQQDNDLKIARLGGEAAKTALRENAETLEQNYLEGRAILNEAIGQAGLSIDEDLPKINSPMRKSISLDTEMWQMALAPENQDPKVCNPPADPSKWRQEAMPYRASDVFFRSWFYPVVLEGEDHPTERPKNPYAKHHALEGWEDYVYNDWYGQGRLWFQKEVELDFDPEGQICEYSCGCIWGRVHLFANGKYCGMWDIPIGKATIPVRGLHKGKNTITIFYENFRAAGMHEIPYNEIYHGILGKSWLNFRPQGPEITAIAKPSWRKAKLDVETILDSTNAKVNSELTMKQYVTFNNRVVKRFDDRRVNVPAGEIVMVNNSVLWTDAQCWGIGDAAGSPVLYTMVTDLVDNNGNIVDRKTNTFGFREVWSSGYYLFLNGHRIVIQGEVGYECQWDKMTVPKQMDIVLGALRYNNVNTLRVHDSCYWSEDFMETCDRIGWYAYMNMYPWRNFPGHKEGTDVGEPCSLEEWMNKPYHKENLRRYQNWVKMLENHPCVIILSTDNEVATQAWDDAAQLDRNLKNEKIAAWYNQYVRALTGGRYIMTRDGDVGTWNWDGKWQDDPVCETANFHYPNYEINDRVLNWPVHFTGNRPLIYGENMYCTYFQNGWVTPLKEIMEKRANEVRKLVPLVRDWQVAGTIYMGQGADGFVYMDETGKGSPFGITKDMFEYREKPCYKGWPFVRIDWPALSGPGMRYPFQQANAARGWLNFNWADSDYPTHVQTAVNEAYRENLIPQPANQADPRAECVIRLKNGKADSPITARKVGGIEGREYVTLTDSQGRAYFYFDEPGVYEFSHEGVKANFKLGPMGEYNLKPGLGDVPVFEF